MLDFVQHAGFLLRIPPLQYEEVPVVGERRLTRLQRKFVRAPRAVYNKVKRLPVAISAPQLVAEMILWWRCSGALRRLFSQCVDASTGR